MLRILATEIYKTNSLNPIFMGNIFTSKVNTMIPPNDIIMKSKSLTALGKKFGTAFNLL